MWIRRYTLACLICFCLQFLQLWQQDGVICWRCLCHKAPTKHLKFIITLSPHPEELLGGSRVQGSICDLRLFGEVFGALNGRNHPLHSQESSQVGRVRRDDDEREEPPHTPHYATRQRPVHTRRKSKVFSWCDVITWEHMPLKNDLFNLFKLKFPT